MWGMMGYSKSFGVYNLLIRDASGNLLPRVIRGKEVSELQEPWSIKDND
jgi:hypothetical protein